MFGFGVSGFGVSGFGTSSFRASGFRVSVSRLTFRSDHCPIKVGHPEQLNTSTINSQRISMYDVALRGVQNLVSNARLGLCGVSGFEFRISGFRFRVSTFGFRVSGFGFRV